MRIRGGSFGLLLIATRARCSSAIACGTQEAARWRGPCRRPPAGRRTTPPPPPPAADGADPRDAGRPGAEPIADDPMTSRSLDELNRNSPLKPVFFELRQRRAHRRRPARRSTPTPACSSATRRGQITIEDTATSAARPSTIWRWASGARSAAQTYLVSLGIPADRLRTVSYGKEFPFDPGHDEAACAKNRRAHFVITAK